MINCSDQPFRFLDLPIKLRLMLYERLPNRTIRTKCSKMDDNGDVSSFTLITDTAPTPILATCKTIKDEASKIILKTAQALSPCPTLATPGLRFAGAAPRIEIDCAS
jgi:hypothetical protein